MKLLLETGPYGGPETFVGDTREECVAKLMTRLRGQTGTYYLSGCTIVVGSTDNFSLHSMTDMCRPTDDFWAIEINRSGLSAEQMENDLTRAQMIERFGKLAMQDGIHWR